MHRTRWLCLLALCAASIALAGCQTTGSSQIVSPCLLPADLAAKSPRPQALPQGDLSQRQVARLWIRDRSEYSRLADRHDDTTRFVKDQCR